MTTANTTTNAPLDPASFGEHLIKAGADILGLQAELSAVHAKLTATPGADDLHAAAHQIESELATAQARHQRLIDARAEAARRFTATAQRQYVKLMQQRRDEVATLGSEMFKAARGLHAALARLRPQLDAVTALGRQRAALTADLMPSAESVSNREARQSAINMADAGGAISLLLEAALRQAGIGHPGPTQNVNVPPPPQFGGDDPKVTHRWHLVDADAPSLAQAQHAQTESNLLHMLDTALTAARARLSIDDSESVATDIA